MGRGPKLPSQALLTFDFGGVGLPFPATPSIGLVGDALQYLEPTWQATVVQASTDLVQLTCTSTVTLNEVRVKIGPEELGPTLTLPVGEPGAEGANQTPPQVALLIRKEVIGITTRRMGRMFWPGVSDGNVDAAGLLDPTARADYSNAFADWQAAVCGSELQLCLFDETSDVRIVNSIPVQPRVSTQRRRLRR